MQQNFRSVVFAGLAFVGLVFALASALGCGPSPEEVAATQAAARVEAARVEAARVETARVEAARVERDSHPFRNLTWGMSEPEARHSLGLVEPGETWTCGDVDYAFLRQQDEDGRRMCPPGALAGFGKPEPLADAPISVIYLHGNPVSTVPPDREDGQCWQPRLLLAGQCVWTEDIQLLFWRGRLLGLTYYPAGSSRRPVDVPVNSDAVAAALDARFGAGRDTSTNEGHCMIPDQPPEGYIRRCRRWENSQSVVELYTRIYSSGREPAVLYGSKATRAEIDGVVRAAGNVATRAAADQAAAAVEAAGGRL